MPLPEFTLFSYKRSRSYGGGRTLEGRKLISCEVKNERKRYLTETSMRVCLGYRGVREHLYAKCILRKLAMAHKILREKTLRDVTLQLGPPQLTSIFGYLTCFRPHPKCIVHFEKKTRKLIIPKVFQVTFIT